LIRDSQFALRISWAALLLMATFFTRPLTAQIQQEPAPTPNESAAARAPEGFRPRFHVEGSAFLNSVSNGFGRWWGGGLEFAWTPPSRMMVSGEVISQARPGVVEQLAGLRTLVNWTKWFYTDATISGGGPNDAVAFFPRFRYDATANFKISNSGLVLNAGYTRLYFGPPVSGEVIRAGAIYYWRKFVVQGNGNWNTAHPGNQKSASGTGALQYGREGRYWLGIVAGGGHEAWQTLSLTPQDIQFTSYSGSVFVRKWLSPRSVFAAAYNYSLKRTAYRINGVELKLFVDF